MASFTKQTELDKASVLAGQVINFMLAPHLVSDDGGPFRFMQFEGGHELEMRLRWRFDYRDLFSDSRIFLKEIERILKPISEAISYGDVVDLRKENAQLKSVLHKSQEAEKETLKDLQRYKDAWILHKGGSL
jgi:hypothetical protein